MPWEQSGGSHAFIGVRRDFLATEFFDRGEESARFIVESVFKRHHRNGGFAL